MAISSSDQSFLEFLLKKNVLNINSKNINEETPLHKAARLGNIEAAKLLIQYGADIGISGMDGLPIDVLLPKCKDEEEFKKILCNENSINLQK